MARSRTAQGEDLVEIDWERLDWDLIGAAPQIAASSSSPPWWNARCGESTVVIGQRCPVYHNDPALWPYPYSLVLGLIEWGCGLDRLRVHGHLVNLLETRTMEYRLSNK